MLGERLGGRQLFGMALVIGGVVLTTRMVPPEGATHRDLVIGALWGVGSMATLALGIIWAKPVLEHSSVLWATTFRQVASFAAMAPIAIALKDRRQIWAVFRPRADAGKVAFHDKCREFSARTFSACKHRVKIGDATVRDPDLFSVE